MKNNYIKIDFIDADAKEWQALDYLSSGGTRAKRVLQNIKGKQFFFKESDKREARNNMPAKYYKYEFFNEIIAYNLGKQLGLDMLKYDIGVFDGKIGCISPRMNNLDNNEELVEFGKYMIALNPSFDPNTNSARKEYSFQLLINAFEHFGQEKYINYIFQVLLFDAIIGNVDRHQENWAFITKPSTLNATKKPVKEMIKDESKPKIITKFLNWLYKTEDPKVMEARHEALHLYVSKTLNTAPIYDSGSSLARELTEEKVNELYNNEEALKKYINKGQAELHWNNEKKTHFDLVEEILKTDWKNNLKHAALFLDKFEETFVEKIINQINKKIPKNWVEYKIPETRKKLISKIVSLRVQELKSRISARV